MRSLTLFLVLLASALFAQTQQDIYRQALEAEEAGDVSKSIELFEKARDVRSFFLTTSLRARLSITNASIQSEGWCGI